MRAAIYPIIIFSALCIPVLVSAQADAVNADTFTDAALDTELQAIVDDPGILPDSPLFVAKRWWENVQVFFTFNAEHKAEREQKLALRRLAEAEQLIEKGNAEAADRHLNRYNAQLERFQERVQAMQDTDPEKAEAMLQRFEYIQEHQQQVLQRVYDQVPEEAQGGILNAIGNSASGIERAIEHFTSNSEQSITEFKNRVQERVTNEQEDVRLEIREQLRERGVIGANANTNTNTNTNTNSPGN